MKATKAVSQLLYFDKRRDPQRKLLAPCTHDNHTINQLLPQESQQYLTSENMKHAKYARLILFYRQASCDFDFFLERNSALQDVCGTCFDRWCYGVYDRVKGIRSSISTDVRTHSPTEQCLEHGTSPRR